MSHSNPLDILLPSSEEEEPTQVNSWRWGTVIQRDPLRVMLDGDDIALDAVPSNVAGNLWEGARVYVQINGTRPVVIGVGGGGGAIFLGEIWPSGVRSANIDVPTRYQGTFRKYEFNISARALGENSVVRSMSIRPNNYSGEYRYTSTAFEGNLVNTDGSSSLGSFPRTVYLGASHGFAVATLMESDNYVYGTAHGFSQSGTSERRTFVTGQMSDKPASEAIETFQLIMNISAATFGSESHIELWGYR